ncbi:SGNH/GDSL hydrolase family protein [uncultured Draconibacterium sp.]|uniref:SGNH/GDSL hydrolase family protein n=1 Tax=uncultured Draconibacterium sp. TaxID=1573823 RepID=UPI0029C64D6C|nr:SGNH/GDSL hydrolase family protein [uncultured Draconibacterium sp.]
MNCKKIILVLIACAIFGASQAQHNIPPFKSGERVVFVGNSITHGGYYHSFIWLYYMTRFPEMPISIMNAGVGGDTAGDIKERLEDDIFSKNPTYMTMTFGMNDVGYYDFYKDDAQEIAERQIKKSFDHYQTIEKRMQDATEVTKVIIGGSPYDETSKIESDIFPTKNAALLKVNDFLQASAKENNWGFVDFARPMMEIDRREQKKDSLFNLEGGDRIHPDNDGHMVMAYIFLKAQGLAGKKVAEIAIDAKAENINVAENCKISNLKADGKGISFNYKAKALPYPVDSIVRGWGSKKSQKDALKLIPFTKEFNQELLKVDGLANGMYQLNIDGQLIEKFSSSDLAKGVNMAELTNTPQYRQATEIMLLNENRIEIERRFRDYAWMQFSFLQGKDLLFANNQEALDTISANWDDAFVRGNFGIYQQAQYPEIRQVWQDEIDLIVKTIYSINKPVDRKIELIKVQ